jgi:hypothetical protein
MMRHALVQITLIGSAMCSTAFAEGSISVEKSAFCTAVDHLNPVGVFKTTAVIEKGEPLYFWMRVRGSEGALKMLESWRRLPIYYTWVKGGQTGLVDIGIKPSQFSPSTLQRLKWEFEQKGYFTWRTYGYSQHLSTGNWEVSVLDGNRKIVKVIPPPVNNVFRPSIELVIK